VTTCKIHGEKIENLNDMGSLGRKEGSCFITAGGDISPGASVDEEEGILIYCWHFCLSFSLTMDCIVVPTG